MLPLNRAPNKSSPEQIVDLLVQAVVSEDLEGRVPLLGVQAMSLDKQRILWHQRLGHIHSELVADMHKHAHGVPELREADEVQKCPTCIKAKMQKRSRSKEDSRHATKPFQGISIDFGFMVTRSKDKKRYVDLVGLNGETCYCMIADHFLGALLSNALLPKNLLWTSAIIG